MAEGLYDIAIVAVDDSGHVGGDVKQPPKSMVDDQTRIVDHQARQLAKLKAKHLLKETEDILQQITQAEMAQLKRQGRPTFSISRDLDAIARHLKSLQDRSLPVGGIRGVLTKTQWREWRPEIEKLAGDLGRFYGIHLFCWYDWETRSKKSRWLYASFLEMTHLSICAESEDRYLLVHWDK